jgi:hypothetical protein
MGKSRNWLRQWRRYAVVSSAVALVGALMLVGGAGANARPSARPAADQLLETVTVDAANPKYTFGTVELQKGVRYELKVSGTYTISYPNGIQDQYDALYCYGGHNQDGTPTCQTPQYGEEFVVGEGNGAPQQLGAGYQTPSGAGSTLPYSSTHVYDTAFYPVDNGKLDAEGPYGIYHNAQNTYSGTITIQIYGPPNACAASGSRCARPETVKFGVSLLSRVHVRTVGGKHPRFLQTSAQGVGKLTVPSAPMGVHFVDSTSASGSIDYSELRFGGPRVVDIDVLTLRVTSGKFSITHAGARYLILEVEVSKSETTGCAVGSTGILTLLDGEQSRKPDELLLTLHDCGVSEYATANAKGERLAVSIQGGKSAPA